MLNPPNRYNPDILDCIANLSNDEVFTSPKLANKMLDMVPQELFSDPEAKFLDPCCKSGVFLREIVKRLDVGLESKIPDRQERIDHILQKQVFGIAITDITAQLSRRTVYCSKYANKIEDKTWESLGKDKKTRTILMHSYSISEFPNDFDNGFSLNPIQGNIRFDKSIKHNFKNNGLCNECGISKKSFKEHEHAYEFIHITTKRLEEFKNMQWDLIIGNPPYQLSDSSLSASAKPIYNIFVQQAKKLEPRYLVMIIPSRWMTCGKGVNDFREEMLSDKHITQLHDFINSSDCFNGVDIKGGVCYFLREKEKTGKCKITTYNSNGQQTSERYLKEGNSDIFIRQSGLISIKEKVWKDNKEESFSSLVSVRKPYGFSTDFFNPLEEKTVKGKKEKVKTTTEEKYGLKSPSDTPIKNGYEIIGLVKGKRVWKYLPHNYDFPKKEGIGKYKIFISKAYGCGAIGEVPSTPVLGTPVQVCTETFLQIGPWDKEEDARNCLKYIKTKFFRALVSIVKQTQDASKKVYQYVPVQKFSDETDIDWSKNINEIDQQLYKKYKLSKEDIEFIENNITEMIDSSKKEES